MQPQVITLANDASWTGWGACLANQDGPITVSHLALGPPNKRASKTKHNRNPPLLPTHRTARLREYLLGPMALVLADGQLMRAPTDPLVRVVVEIPPMAFGKGKASAYIGVARIVGAIELWGCRPNLGTPWLIEPGQWRKWWEIKPSRKGRGSEELKADAISLVEENWGEHWLAPFHRTKKGGPRGDVAEAILLAVGSSKHPGEAPAGPRDGWPIAPAGNWFPT